MIESTIESIARILEERYVFPKMGKGIGKILIANKLKGKYDGIKDGHILALRVNEDLYIKCRDEHLSIKYDPVPENRDAKSKPSDDVSQKDILDNFSGSGE